MNHTLFTNVSVKEIGECINRDFYWWVQKDIWEIYRWISTEQTWKIFHVEVILLQISSAPMIQQDWTTGFWPLQHFTVLQVKWTWVSQQPEPRYVTGKENKEQEDEHQWSQRGSKGCGGGSKWQPLIAPSLCGFFFFFLLLPPVPAASLTAWPPLEQHKQLETIDWARASQNISGTVAHRNKIQEGLAELKVNYFSDTRLKLINYEYINSKTFNSKKILIKNLTGYI